MSGFGQSPRTRTNKSEEDSPKKAIRELVWYKPDPSVAYGKNIAITGKSKAGKTLLMCLLGYFREEFRDDIIDAGYDRVVEAMDKKVLPTIHNILVIESETNLLKSLNAGTERDLLQPLMDLDVFQVAPVTFERKEVALADDNKIITLRREEIEECKQQFDYTVREVLRRENKEGTHTLFAIDSMTGYKKILDDKFGLLYEVISNKNNAVMDGIDTYRQSFYASRNSWSENIMQLLRTYKGWQVTTFKGEDTPPQYLKPGEDPYNIKWVNGTEFFLDMIYKVTRITETVREIEIMDGRYVPSDPEEMTFPYPCNDKMGAMPLIDSMCEKLLGRRKNN